MTRDDVTQAFYSRWAGAYDLLASHAPGVDRLRERAVDALDLDPGDTVVDVGCGTGATLPHLREAVGPDGTVVGVDFSPGPLARARRRTAGHGNVHVVRGDGRSLPLGAAEVDAVIASFVSGMLEDPSGVVGDWADLVGPGGRVALVDLARSPGVGRPLNPLYALAVRATSPPGAAGNRDVGPATLIDRRVAAAHERLAAACETTTTRSAYLDFVRVTAGRVAPDDGE